uniref:Uncharacterized protein n=1 Tax=Cajanus cajan TaxID=3821 RepID=A0A151UB35_CAJCA|nr:hypothetical protein KK1_020737 [Cajanus cajan]
MESKGGKKKCSSSKSLLYEAPLDYIIEDVRPHGGIKKFRSAAYSNVIFSLILFLLMTIKWRHLASNMLSNTQFFCSWCSASASHPEIFLIV